MCFKTSCPGRWMGTVLVLALLQFLPVIPSAADSEPVFLPLAFNQYGLAKPLQNGSFDLGLDGTWQESTFSIDPILWKAADIPSDPNFSDITAQSGEWVAWLGGLDDENATLSQRIVIPDRATTLNYYYWIESNETADNCNFDTATVRLGGNTLQTYDLCATTNTGGWVLAQINISTYRGQSLDLIFQVITDSSDTSSLYVDTVSIATE